MIKKVFDWWRWKEFVGHVGLASKIIVDVLHTEG